jgi:hypothetical protein
MLLAEDAVRRIGGGDRVTNHGLGREIGNGYRIVPAHAILVLDVDRAPKVLEDTLACRPRGGKRELEVTVEVGQSVIGFHPARARCDIRGRRRCACR